MTDDVNNRTHYYMKRANDVLHINDNCINTLFDNHITDSIKEFNNIYIEITEDKFNEMLINAILNLDIHNMVLKNK